LVCLSGGLAFADVADRSTPSSSASKSSVGDHTPVGPSSSQAKPQIYAQVYGDWIYRCAVQSGDTATHPRCAVAQQMVFQQKGKTIPLLTLAFAPAEHGGSGHVANILAPLDVLLPSGIGLSVDAAPVTTLPYTFCDVAGCWSIGSSADAFIGAAQIGKVGHAEVQLVNGRKVTINFSLNGLARALAALDSGVPPANKARPTA